MYGERRTHMDILASILDACQDLTLRTQVMYRCNLSFKQLTGYLDLLLKTHLLLIQNDPQHSLLIVSSKGKKFLKAYSSIMALME